jgi:molybdopterin-guanine dinucleotide biosynthesis protein A
VASHEHCLIVACDMPLLSPAILAYMAAQPRDYDVLIPQTPGVSRQGNSGQIYQTLHAIYSAAAPSQLPPSLLPETGSGWLFSHVKYAFPIERLSWRSIHGN